MKRALLAIVPFLVAGVLSAAKPDALSKASNEMNAGFRLYEEKKDYSAARKHLQAAYDAGIRTGTLSFRLGYCKEKTTGDKTAAKDLYKESLALYKDDPSDTDNYKKAYYNYGVIYFDMVKQTDNLDSMIKYLDIAQKIWDEGLSVHKDNSYIKKQYSLLDDARKKIDEKRRSR